MMLERVRASAERVFDVPHGPDGLETEADHTNAFNQSLGRTIKEIIYRGLVCISARRKFRGKYESWVRDTLHCSKAYAFKCRVIADNKFLANVSNWKLLPHSTAALYALSGIPQERLQILADGGELHAMLTIDESVALAEAEQGEYRPRRESAPAARQQRREPENTDNDADTNDIESSDAGNAIDADIADGDGEIDSQRLLIDAEDIGEELKTAFARCRRRIDAIETHSDPTAKSMLANELRGVAATLNYRADALDPPSTVDEETEDSEPQADRIVEPDIESESLPDDDAPWDEDMNRDDEPIAHKRSIPRVKSKKRRRR
jgi:hypothetical protein